MSAKATDEDEYAEAASDRALQLVIATTVVLALTLTLILTAHYGVVLSRHIHHRPF